MVCAAECRVSQHRLTLPVVEPVDSKLSGSKLAGFKSDVVESPPFGWLHQYLIHTLLSGFFLRIRAENIYKEQIFSYTDATLETCI